MIMMELICRAMRTQQGEAQQACQWVTKRIWCRLVKNKSSWANGVVKFSGWHKLANPMLSTSFCIALYPANDIIISILFVITCIIVNRKKKIFSKSFVRDHERSTHIVVFNGRRKKKKKFITESKKYSNLTINSYQNILLSRHRSFMAVRLKLIYADAWAMRLTGRSVSPIWLKVTPFGDAAFSG